MIDLTPIETALNATGTYTAVQGCMDIKPALEDGINGDNAVFVMPLVTTTQPISRGVTFEDKSVQRFAVIVGLSTGGATHAGSNKVLTDLVVTAIQTLFGQSLGHYQEPIDLGNGAMLPITNNGCVFWQQEFSITYYQ